MGITISFENDTDHIFEVAIAGPMGNITLAKKRLAPRTMWMKTDEGLSAGMLYTVRLYQLAHINQPSEELASQQPLTCKVQAPTSKGEIRYKVSDIMKGEAKATVISSATAQEIMTGAVQSVGLATKSATKSAMKTVGINMEDEVKKEEDHTKKENVSSENKEADQAEKEDHEDADEPVTFTALEKRMLKEKHPKTRAEREAYKSAVAKKHHIKWKPKTKKQIAQTKELMAENQKLGVQRGKELEETSQQAGEVEEEAKKAMDTFKQLRLQSQKKDPLGFLNF
eukprot:CAMPEP_0167787306 /NCGR_PEP_ID=MMETSP0111_2-20121227/9334_1 /TAXON_ID=91324 /ORGANISM="Lotharella globosa, Strain CCCM811" /LENGTH=282 /DNA_ID=CAMNT_0007678903 /DNA_START=140 /DNA_END=988 /DNA_ORIENTATION=+